MPSLFRDRVAQAVVSIVGQFVSQSRSDTDKALTSMAASPPDSVGAQRLLARARALAYAANAVFHGLAAILRKGETR